MNDDKLQKIIDELHIYEKKVLKGLESAGFKATPEEIVESQKMDIKAVMSAAGILESRGLIEVQKEVKDVVSLTDDGKQYAQTGLPERKILESLGMKNSIPMKEIGKETGLDSSEVKIAIGWLIRKKWASINQGIVDITEEGREALATEYHDEQFLKKLLEVPQFLFFEPSKMIKNGFNLLKQRKGVIKVKKEVNYILKVTPKGLEVLKLGVDLTYTTTQLTHEQLKTGSWRIIEVQKLRY